MKDPTKLFSERIPRLTPSQRCYSEVLVLITYLDCSRAEQNVPNNTPNYLKCACFLGCITNENMTAVLSRFTKTFLMKVGLC